MKVGFYLAHYNQYGRQTFENFSQRELDEWKGDSPLNQVSNMYNSFNSRLDEDEKRELLGLQYIEIDIKETTFKGLPRQHDDAKLYFKGINIPVIDNIIKL